jgi:hypothetical protein
MPAWTSQCYYVTWFIPCSLSGHLLGEGDRAVGDSLILELPALRTGLPALRAPPPSPAEEKGDIVRPTGRE